MACFFAGDIETNLPYDFKDAAAHGCGWSGNSCASLASLHSVFKILFHCPQQGQYSL